MEDNKYLQRFFYGLDHAWERLIEKPLPELPSGWGKSVFTDITVDLSFYHLIWQFIRNCKLDVLERTVEVMEEMNACVDVESRRLLPNEIYQVLSGLSHETAVYLLSMIECSDGVYGELSDALLMKDSAKFVNAIKDCNTIGMKSVINFILYLQNKERLFELKKNQANETLAINPSNTIDENITVLERVFGAMSLADEELKHISQKITLRNSFESKRFSDIIIKNEGGELENVDSDIEFDDWYCSYRYFSHFFWFCKLRDSGVLRIRNRMSFEYLFRLPAVRGLYDEGMRCWENNSWEEKMSEFESRLQDNSTDEGKESINDTEQSTPQIEELDKEEPQPEQLSAADYEQTFFPTHNSFEQETTMKDVPLYPDSKYGFIPEDYFNQKIDNAHPDDHYELVDEIIDEGEEMFVGFVNYIAKHQYIENDNKTKALFAYRLSGRIRPNEEDIRAIPWWAPNKSPKELLYIIRYCVDKGSHKKFSVQMTDFFEGPDWPTEGYSTMADEADTNFRKALHAMYAVCGLKYTKPKKKKKW